MHAYLLPVRLLAAAARTVAALALLSGAFLLVFDAFAGELGDPKAVLNRWVGFFFVAPWTFAWLLHRLSTATLEVAPAQLVLTVGRARYEIPRTSVAAVRAWRFPVPGPGLSLRMTSGRTFRYGLSVPDPVPLLEALSRAGVSATDAQAHPITRFAQAKHAASRRRTLSRVLKYGVFPLAPTLLVFRLHQYIAFGGAFGEYYLKGLGPYLKTFFSFWAFTVAQLLCYASVWRALAELAAISAAGFLPRRAGGVRRFAEIACLLLYYVGIPALVLVRALT